MQHRHYLEALGKNDHSLVLSTSTSQLITLILLCTVPGFPRDDSGFLLRGVSVASVRPPTWEFEALNLYTSFSISEALAPKVAFHASGILVVQCGRPKKFSDETLNVATSKKRCCTLTPRHLRLSPSLAKTSSCGNGSVNCSDIRVAGPAWRQVSQ